MVAPANRKPRNGVGLAEELAGDAGDAVADQEHAGQQAEPRAHASRAGRAAPSPSAAPRLPAAPGRAGSGWRGTGPPVGKTIAQGSQSGAARPHSSPLMKLAMRPEPEPDRRHHGDAVGEAEHRDALAAAEPDDRRPPRPACRRGSSCRPARPPGSARARPGTGWAGRTARSRAARRAPRRASPRSGNRPPAPGSPPPARAATSRRTSRQPITRLAI